MSLTEAVPFLIPDLVTVHGVDEQVPDPLAPLLHVQETLVEIGAPFCVTETTTLAFHRDPLRVAVPCSATDGGAVTVIVRVALPVALSSSVAVRVTEYVPANAYECDTDPPEAPDPSPKSHAREAIVPSESEPDPVNVHANPLHEKVNDAVGG
jgi:hypothetical protein